MGHHNANLDPLGISCVNFDESPVATGFQHVGEKCFLYPTAQQTTINEPVLCDCRFPLPFYLSLFLSFSSFPCFSTLIPQPPLHPTLHFIFNHTSSQPSCSLAVLHFLLCARFLPPSISFPCGWFCARLPCLWGDLLSPVDTWAPCGSAGPSWDYGC